MVQIITVLLHAAVNNDTEMIVLPVQRDSKFRQVFVIAKDMSVRSHSLAIGASVMQMSWHPSGS